MNPDPKLAGPSVNTVYSTESDDLEHDPPESPEIADPVGTQTSGKNGTTANKTLGHDLKRGDRVGRFTILDMLGMGGMGVVFTAYDDVLDRQVALKLVLDRRADIRWQARMLREAKALARLSHPNVVQIYEAGTFGDRIYLAMELVQGKTLRQWLNDRSQKRHATNSSTPTAISAPDINGIPEIIACFEQAGRGLAAAHSVGLVHRDFKPDNVLVSDNGRVYVVDFGLVLTSTQAGADSQGDPSALIRHMNIHDRDLTRAGAIMGTTAYMSPEQWAGQPVSALSDQFSFCVALHEALHQSRPHHGTDVSELRANVSQGKRTDRKQNRAVPTWVQSALDRGLAVEPEKRWPSMHDLLGALTNDPRRARRRRWALTLGATALAGTLVAPSVYEGHQKSRCRALAEDATTPWTAHRDEVRSALLATGLPFAEKSAERVEIVLDAWTQEWQNTRAAACMSANRGGPFAEKRESCLDHQLARLNSLVPLLATAETSVTQHAVGAAENLPNVDRCDDPKRLSTELRTAFNPAARAEFKAVRSLNFSAAAHAALGSLDRGLDAAEEALALARATRIDVLIAEALSTTGELHIATGSYDSAQEALIEAYYLAGEIGHPRVAAQAAVDLISLLGSHLAKPKEAMRWARDATMWLGYLDLESDMLGAHYHNHMAMALVATGSFEQALEHSERALEILTAKLGPNHPDVAGAHNNLGLMQGALGRSKESLESFREALSIAIKTVGDKHPDTATAENNIGSWYLENQEPAQALAPLKHALEIRRAALGEEHIDVADSLGNVGVALRELGRYAQALDNFEQSLRIRRMHFPQNHPDIALSLRSIASTQRALGHAQEASDAYEEALSIYQRVYGDNRPESAMIELTLGELSLELGREQMSIEHLQAGLQALAANSEQDPAQLGGLVTLARAYSSQGQLKASITTLERARSIASANEATDATALAEIEFSLAKAIWTARAKGDPLARERALGLARRAYERLTEIDDHGRAPARTIADWIKTHEPPA
ncbi:MAG TPA: serine/threonine protein kinase [Nannocystis exedens]|nr:serine/threonine protein kinase [Nannocystis exedens]